MSHRPFSRLFSTATLLSTSLSLSLSNQCIGYRHFRQTPLFHMSSASSNSSTSNSNSNNLNSNNSATELETQVGWEFDSVNPTTGKTSLDELYEKQLQRIRHVFARPLPPLPRDGNINPDFFIGFSFYQFQQRDQYRAVLARALEIPLKDIKLSVAWSGRFDVTRFNRVQKVCGVCINNKDNNNISQRISKLVKMINEKQSEILLSLHLVQASEAIPEVEFAAAEREAVIAERVYSWIQEYILRPHLVVVLYGNNNNNNNNESSHSGGGDMERQRAFIEEKWIKAFTHRRIVPHIISFTNLIKKIQEAAERNELEGLTISFKQKEEPEKEKEDVKKINKSEENTSSKLNSDNINDEKYTTPLNGEDSMDSQHKEEDKEIFQLPSLKDEIAWNTLIRKALFRRHDNRTYFPLLFVHGECAGGVEEMRYLLHNREALDAILLHPNDVAFKKKFISRLRSSHARLRMTEEMSN